MTEPCTFRKLADNVYTMTPDSRTDRPSLGAIVGTTGTLLVETGNSTAHLRLFLDALAAEGVPAPRYAALTHWHWDHMFGSAALDGIPIFAYEETARQIALQASYAWDDAALDQRVVDGLEIAFCCDMIKAELPDRSNLQIVVPNVRFTDSVTLDLGGITCEIAHVGGDHSPDSAVVYVPEARALFLGDCHYPNIHHTPRFYTPDVVFPLVEKLLGYDAEVYVEGHGTGSMTRAEFEQFAADLHAACEAVERFPNDREAALRDLQPRYADLEEVDWLVDAFMAGRARTPA